MKNRFILVLLIYFFVMPDIKAQMEIDFGARGGLALSTFQGDYENTSFKIGYTAGVVANIPVGDFSVQPSVLLSNKGSKAEYSGELNSYQEKFSLNYLEVPVYGIYNFNLRTRNFQLIGGPYVAYGMAGKYTREEIVDGNTYADETENIQFVKDQVDREGFQIPFYNLDYGIKAGLGYVRDNIHFQFVYSYGLSNLVAPFDGEDPPNSMINTSFQFSLSYFFEKKEEVVEEDEESDF